MAGFLIFGSNTALYARQIKLVGRCCVEFTRSLSTVPPKPKRPLSGFIVFSQSQKIPANTPFRERGVINAKNWKLLTEEQKQEYSPSQALLEAYNKDLTEWQASLTDEQSAKIENDKANQRAKLAKLRLKKKRRELGMPVRGGLSAWNFYVESLPIPRGDAPVTLYIKGLAEQWKKMPEQDKEAYEEKAVKAKAKYFDELEMWENEMIQAGHYDVVRKTSLPIEKTVKKQKKQTEEKKPDQKLKKSAATGEDVSWMREE